MSTVKSKEKEITYRKYIDNNTIYGFVSDCKQMKESLSLISDILKDEGFSEKKEYFKEEKALNLDKYEILVTQGKKGRQRQETVDFVVGLENNWLLLVEAKLRVDNVDNIAKGIKDKIKHSRDILQACDNYVHDEKVVIVLLKNQNFQQQINRFKRMLNYSPDIEPLKVADFHSRYFCNK